jgi:Domain of unknown function (DUF4178)
VTFELGATLLKVCEHCGTAVARRGADLANYGKVAALLPTPSVLKIGLEGDYEGAPPFRLMGRLQLDSGNGGWDEWLMGFSDGSWAWLSEAQGRFHYMGQAALPPLPGFDQVRPGQTVDLGPPGTFVVAEVRRARFASALGELPFAIAPGSELRYADLSGPGGRLATIDYGSGDAPEALYVGSEVTLEQLGFSDLPTAEDRQTRVAGEDLKCPQCGGPVDVRAPDQTQRIACPYCGSLLDATHDLAVLEALARPELQPAIPLGSKGRLGGVEWTAIGAMERSVTVEGVRYPWREYLLYEPRQGFRWLVEAKGHWSFVEPLAAGDIGERYGQPEYGGEKFAHFQSGMATVDHVLGEFYWAVARGDQTETDDYVVPPRMLSREVAESEITWSLGTYAEPDTVWKAFQLEGSPPEREGVGPNQPWTGTNPKQTFQRALLAVAALVVLYLVFSVAGSKTIHKQAVDIPPTAMPGAPEAAVFAGPMFVSADSNLQVKVQAPVSNSWLYLEGALINEETGAIDEFDLEVSYYSGTDSDGSWSEGSTTGARYIPAVPAGRYTMRLEPQWQAGQRPPGSYALTVTSRVPRFYHAFLAALALLVWPAGRLWRYFRFETERWSESDHPWVESSDEEEDEDE